MKWPQSRRVLPLRVTARREVTFACRTHIFPTWRRHQQHVDFPAVVDAWQDPRFVSLLPAWTLRRGPIRWWQWEPAPGEGVTRLWVPTELGWWIRLSQAWPAMLFTLACTLPGGAGLGAYQDPRNWLMVYLRLASDEWSKPEDGLGEVSGGRFASVVEVGNPRRVA